MDDRNGNIYRDRDEALAANVPAVHVQEVEAIYGELLRITSGPNETLNGSINAGPTGVKRASVPTGRSRRSMSGTTDERAT